MIAGTNRSAERGRLIAGTLILAALALLAYWPALHGGFISDDDNSLTGNPLIAAADGLRRIWLTDQPHDYWPLSYTTFWVEWRIWGLHSAGYHVTNVLLQVADGLLLWRVLTRLKIPGAFLGALLFTLHPVNVESVAWITQRKNLLAMVFYLLSILCFAETDPGIVPGPGHRQRSARWYWFSLAAFVLAMLSKGSVAPLPLVLLGIIGWHRQLTPRDGLRIAPFFAVAALFTVVNIWFQAHVYSEIRTAGLGQRMLGSAAVVWFYLGKAIWPRNLAFIYPLWRIEASDLRWWIPLIAAAGVTAGLGILGRRGGPKWARGALFAWLYFCVMLSPVMGFTDVAFMKSSLVADHYQHLALIGVTTLAGAGLASWMGRRPAAMRAGYALSVLLVGLFGFLTFRQCLTYRDMRTLYETTVARNPGSWMAQVNLADVLAKVPGKQAEAIAHYEEAVRLAPYATEAHNNLGLQYAQIPGRQAEAIAQYEEALRTNPNYAKAHNNLALELAKIAGRENEAMAHYQAALRIDPNYADAHNNFAVELAGIPGRQEEAIAHYQEAVRLDPGSAKIHGNLATELAKVPGREGEAIVQYQEALRLDPDSAATHNNLALELVKIPGRLKEAIAHYQEALRLDPNDAKAHNNLAVAYAGEGRIDEAIAQLEMALKLDPSLADVRDNLRQLNAARR